MKLRVIRSHRSYEHLVFNFAASRLREAKSRPDPEFGRQKQATQETVISIASWKRKKFNQHLMVRLFGKLGLSRDCEKIARLFDEFSGYGAIAT